jgi:hypothetical protein
MRALLPLFAVVASSFFLGRLLWSDEAPAVENAFHPAPQHAMLQKLAGTWDAVLIVKDEKGAEVRTRGTMTTVNHAAFHTVDSFEGEFMGLKMSGHGINGYCPARKQFFRLWTDSMTASPMTLRGDYDQKQRELTMRGECLGMSGKLEPCRTVTRFRDDDHVEWALFGAGPDGKEMQHLRIEYTRRK